MKVDNKNVQKNDLFTPTVTKKNMLKKVAKIALLVLAAPITLVLLAAGYKERIGNWLIQDSMLDRCKSIWIEFYNSNRENGLYETNKDEIKQFVDNFPKLAVYYSTIISSDGLYDYEIKEKFNRCMSDFHNWLEGDDAIVDKEKSIAKDLIDAQNRAHRYIEDMHVEPILRDGSNERDY